MIKDKFTAIVVDDSQEAIDYLCDILSDHKGIIVSKCFTDPKNAIIEINKSKPDILFLDVQMPEKTGFDVVKEVRSDDYLPHIIFTTAFEKFAIRAIKYAAFDYLLKPINPHELETAIDKLSNTNEKTSKQQRFKNLFFELDNSKPVKFNTSTGFVIIHPSEIIYLEASRNYCEIHLTDNRMELVTTNMNQVFGLLPPTSFFRISRSHTVNLNLIQKVERSKKECHILSNGEAIVLKISRNEIKELEQMFSSNLPI